MTTITKTEREDLQRLIRQRERVLKSAAKQRSAELLDDRDTEDGWRCIPIPPTDDPTWFVVDSSNDCKTTWGRWHSAGG
jgi:hypothetical protein